MHSGAYAEILEGGGAIIFGFIAHCGGCTKWSAEGTTILGGSGGMLPPENFAKLHLKIRYFGAIWEKFLG